MKFKVIRQTKSCVLFGMLLLFLMQWFSCRSTARTENTTEIPEGDVQVAVYYFPNWGPVEHSEWQLIQKARPCFDGHQQPKVPLWGYENENLPEVMAKKIAVAAGHGIDAFIFDWYYRDPPYGTYLAEALEEGFLKAENNAEIQFALMWCNHDVVNGKGVVRPETFEEIMDYVIEKYFKHPSYWLIDGCPYFSVWRLTTFMEVYGGNLDKAAEAMELFRTKVKRAGFRDLHLNSQLAGLDSPTGAMVEKLQVNSITSYHMLSNIAWPPTFPAMKYEEVSDAYFRCVESGGGTEGLEQPVKSFPVPYHLNVSMGWDSSPRCRNAPDWMERREYPFGAVIVENTPRLFKKALVKAKKLIMEKPEKERIITINSWNEWGEGSYLEPDMITGTGYLEAIRDVFSGE
jgi:hypothetical protein